MNIEHSIYKTEWEAESGDNFWMREEKKRPVREAHQLLRNCCLILHLFQAPISVKYLKDSEWQETKHFVLQNTVLPVRFSQTSVFFRPYWCITLCEQLYNLSASGSHYTPIKIIMPLWRHKLSKKVCLDFNISKITLTKKPSFQSPNVKAFGEFLQKEWLFQVHLLQSFGSQAISAPQKPEMCLKLTWTP